MDYTKNLDPSTSFLHPFTDLELHIFFFQITIWRILSGGSPREKFSFFFYTFHLVFYGEGLHYLLSPAGNSRGNFPKLQCHSATPQEKLNDFVPFWSFVSMSVTALLWLIAVTDENRQFAASWENNRRNEKTNNNSQVLWPRERRATSFSHIQSWTTQIQFSSFHHQQIIRMFPIP